jgi:hypothetical protein
LAGFGFVWEIVWLWVASLVAIIVSIVVKSFMEDTEYIIPAAEVKKLEKERLKHAPRLRRRKLPARITTWAYGTW